MSIVGYTRVSTQDQNLNSQIDALKAAGAEHIYLDKITGKNANRLGLIDCVKFLRRRAPNPTVVAEIKSTETWT